MISSGCGIGAGSPPLTHKTLAPAGAPERRQGGGCATGAGRGSSGYGRRLRRIRARRGYIRSALSSAQCQVQCWRRACDRRWARRGPDVRVTGSAGCDCGLFCGLRCSAAVPASARIRPRGCGSRRAEEARGLTWNSSGPDTPVRAERLRAGPLNSKTLDAARIDATCLES
jgi:hypothetical protein